MQKTNEHLDHEIFLFLESEYLQLYNITLNGLLSIDLPQLGQDSICFRETSTRNAYDSSR